MHAHYRHHRLCRPDRGFGSAGRVLPRSAVPGGADRTGASGGVHVCEKIFTELPCREEGDGMGHDPVCVLIINYVSV